MTTLRQLARGDLVLDLPGWDQADAFGEDLLDQIGTLLARRLAEVPQWSRAAGARALAAQVAHACEVRLHRWTVAERLAFERLAPLATALPGWPAWPRAQRLALGAMLRARGGSAELPYARSATALPRFFRELAAALAAIKGRGKSTQ